LAGLSSALDVRCSVAVRATVLSAVHPIGPIGTSAEFSTVPSETIVAVAYSLEGACWAAGRFIIGRRGGAGGTRRVALVPKKGSM
jgi:hypothetical protein